MIYRQCFFIVIIVFYYTFLIPAYSQIYLDKPVKGKTEETLLHRQNSGQYFSQMPKRIYRTAKVNPRPPVIDGRMNDPAWKTVEWASDFLQNHPYEGKKPSQKTAFKILFDEKNLYVFIKAYDSEPDKITRRMSRRDGFEGDRVTVNLDSHFDKQTAFSFTACVSGVIGDEAVSGDGKNWDATWDPVWYVKIAEDSEGWNAEFRIPFSQLRFANKNEHIWGLQVTRYIYRNEERTEWQLIPNSAPGYVHLLGELHGIRGIKPGRQIELLPYTVGNTQRFKKVPDNPYKKGSLYGLAGGVDGKIGITNDLTMDFTVNPDFGQVEADPSVVNLTAFETFYQEKRPFFIEGRNIFEYRVQNAKLGTRISRDNIFYSRRIGRSPQYYPPTGTDEYAEMPERTSILGAFKLSGKTKSGISIGILESIAAEEHAEIDNLGQKREETVEPLTNYFVGRLQKDFNQGNTIVGGIFTSTNRKIDNPGLNYLHKSAYTGGIDFITNWKDRTYYLGVKGIFSNVRGEKEAITRTQRSPARYYQRPDINYVTFNENRTSLSGYGGTIKFGKRGGGRIRFETGATLRSPGLELNDLGYIRSADAIQQWNWAGYWQQTPFSIFRNFYWNMNYWTFWNFGGEVVSRHQNVNCNAILKNNWGFYGSFGHEGEKKSSTALRGGPSFITPGTTGCEFGVFSDRRKKLKINFGGFKELGDKGSSSQRGFNFGATYRPNDALSMSLGPSFSFSRDNLQFVDTKYMDSSPKYIFAEIDQKTVSFTLRMNYNITPNLTVQYYGMPFISAGTYSNFKKITNPGAERLEDRYHTFDDKEISHNDNIYKIDENNNGTADYEVYNPDFNFKQFRSNLVVRWEYSPGSTLFLVWTQGRTGYAQDGNYSFRNNMEDLFSVYPHNVFLIKYNRWFSL